MAIEKELLDQLLAGRDPGEVFAKDGLLDDLKKALSERILNAELDEHLDEERGDGRANRRNGTSKKSVLTGTSKLSLDIPRDRSGTFDPKLIAKYQRRFPEFDDKIISMYALGKLQALRDRLGKPLIVRSAYRSPEHNRAVGGATRSKHLDGAAFDIAMANHDPVMFEAAAREAGFLGFGFYPRSGFIHVDLGPARQWGERFPVRETAFAAETPPAREVLADSRTMKGGGAAGVATLGAAGVEVAQSVLAETQTAILPLVPYLDTLRWVFIVVALSGIAVTIFARLDDWKRGRR